MQFGSLKCFSSIIENFKKIYRSWATFLEISLSLPNTEESVSSTNDIMDFLKPLLEELTLERLYNFLAGVLVAIELRNLDIYILLCLAWWLMLGMSLLGVSLKYLEVWLEEMRTDFLMFSLNCSSSAGDISTSRSYSSVSLAISFLRLLTSRK